MKQYRLAKDFLGFPKGMKLRDDGIRYLFDTGYVTITESVALKNPDIFEEVKSLEDEIDIILSDMCHKYELLPISIKDYRNKILAIFEESK